MAAKKWTVTDARSINAGQDDSLGTAYGDLEQDLEQRTFQNEEGTAELLDQTMNGFSLAAQFILLPVGFPQLRESRSSGSRNAMTLL